MYSDLYLQQKQVRTFPKVFVVAIVALFALITSQMASWYSTTPAQASQIKLVSHSVANISDTDATVFLETDERCKVFILYGTDPQKLDKTVYVTGESAGHATSRILHAIPLHDLEPSTDHFYKIIADDKVIQASGGAPFTFLTNSKKTIATSARQPIYGRIVRPDGSGLGQAYVYIESQGANEKQTYLATTKDSGEWLTTLPANVAGTSALTIAVMYEGLEPSHIKTTVDRAAPLPQSIVIGSDYTFLSEGSNVLPASTQRSTEKTYPILLLYPEKDAIVPNTRPLFKGFGVPGTQVAVRVNSLPAYEDQIVVNKQGTWTLEPRRPFTAGKYIVMVTIQDNNGQIRVLSRSFVIAKSGEQVLGEQTVATPSGTLAPTRLPSPSLTPGGYVTPTGFAYITATPAPMIVTATPGPYVSPTGELERAGVEVSMWWPIVGSLFAAFGFFLVRITSSTFPD